MRPRQRGVALVQVLLVTTIIILLVMQLSMTAVGQVKRAQALQDRSEAALYLHSQEVALLYSLLTESMISGQESSNPYAAGWNFHGEPFAVDGLQFTLQDQSGLMRFPTSGVSEFEKLLPVLGLGTAEARDLAGQLGDWLGTSPRGSGPGNAMMRGAAGGPVQYFSELKFLTGMDDQRYRQLAELMTLYPTPGFNPLTAPEPLLRMRVSESVLGPILEARRNGDLDQKRLWQIAGIGTDETTSPFVGPGIGVQIEGEFRSVTLRRHVVVGVEPYELQPLTPWSRERFATGIPK